MIGSASLPMMSEGPMMGINIKTIYLSVAEMQGGDHFS
jgi:hypothetical protein